MSIVHTSFTCIHLLKTHNVPLLARVSRKIVEVTVDGEVREQAIAPSGFVDRNFASTPKQQTLQEDQIIRETTQSKGGKLVLAEELVEGHITWKSFMLFLRAHAGSHPVFFTLLWTSLFLFSQIVSASKNWFLGYWGSQYDQREASEVPAPL